MLQLLGHSDELMEKPPRETLTLFGRALLSYTAGDAVVIATWLGLCALTLGILLFKLTLRLYGFVPVEVSAQRGGLFGFRASGRSRRYRAH